MFVLCLKESAEVIGMIDFRLEGFKAHFGFVLARKYWNQGLMTEAMQPLIEYFNETPIYTGFGPPTISRMKHPGR